MINRSLVVMTPSEDGNRTAGFIFINSDLCLECFPTTPTIGYHMTNSCPFFKPQLIHQFFCRAPLTPQKEFFSLLCPPISLSPFFRECLPLHFESVLQAWISHHFLPGTYHYRWCKNLLNKHMLNKSKWLISKKSSPQILKLGRQLIELLPLHVRKPQADIREGCQNMPVMKSALDKSR